MGKNLKCFAKIVLDHLCFWHLGCFLWWLGGFATMIWMKILLYASLGQLPQGRELSHEMILVYLMFLLFCLGTKHVHKRNGKDAPLNPNQDRYKGEFWMAILYLFSLFVINDYLSRGFKFLGQFGEIKTIPYHLYLTVFGASAVLGFSRAGDIWDVIKSFFKIVRRP